MNVALLLSKVTIPQKGLLIRIPVTKWSPDKTSFVQTKLIDDLKTVE